MNLSMKSYGEKSWAGLIRNVVMNRLPSPCRTASAHGQSAPNPENLSEPPYVRRLLNILIYRPCQAAIATIISVQRSVMSAAASPMRILRRLLTRNTALHPRYRITPVSVLRKPNPLKARIRKHRRQQLRVRSLRSHRRQHRQHRLTRQRRRRLVN